MLDYFGLPVEEGGRMVGFTIKYESNKVFKVEFFSRSVNFDYNRWVTGILDSRDPYIPAPVRPQIISALETEFNTIRNKNILIIPLDD